MIVIKNISSYLGSNKVSNHDVLEKFNVSEDFIKNKLGVEHRAIKNGDESIVNMCMNAYKALTRNENIDAKEIELCILVTQNPDVNIPHTSAIIHGELGFPSTCATFDISLGCSGYVYALSIAKAFMNSNHIKKGLIFTCDPYSKIINKNDKNTSMIFGDAATVTFLEEGGNGLSIQEFDFGTDGAKYKNLTIEDDFLYMNGRAVFNFTAQQVPKSLACVLKKANLDISEIEGFFLHQGSKYIIDTICKRAKIPPEKAYFDMYNYGNTVSSSIPLLIEIRLDLVKKDAYYLASGFGVGLSWATCLLKYNKA